MSTNPGGICSNHYTISESWYDENIPITQPTINPSGEYFRDEVICATDIGMCPPPMDLRYLRINQTENDPW